LITIILTELLIIHYTNSVNEKETPDYIKDIIKYIEKRFTEKITLDDLAMKFALSKFCLHKEFKKHIGITPNQYIINCRLNYAKDLLKYSNLSVSEISYQVGIENISHFINLFKKIEHKTPLVFRKEWSFSSE